MNPHVKAQRALMPISHFHGVLRGGVVRRKPTKYPQKDEDSNQLPVKALNCGLGGPMAGGALVGQNKISAEIRKQARQTRETHHILFFQFLHDSKKGQKLVSCLYSILFRNAESAVDCHQPGETAAQGISQYQIIKTLGSGASGIVHLVVSIMDLRFACI